MAVTKSHRTPKPQFWTVNELTPPENNPAVHTQGIVLAVNGERGNQGVFVYSVQAFHPVTHNPFVLTNVRERVDQFYQNQAGRIPVGARVALQRGRTGIWEIQQVEIRPEEFVSPRSGIVSNDKLGSGLYFFEDHVVLSIGDNIITGHSDGRFAIYSGSGVHLFSDSTGWEIGTKTLTLQTNREEISGVEYEYLKVFDPENQEGKEAGTFHNMLWKGGEELSLDVYNLEDPPALIGKAPLDNVRLSRVVREDSSVLGGAHNNNPLTPLSKVPEWGPQVLENIFPHFTVPARIIISGSTSVRVVDNTPIDSPNNSAQTFNISISVNQIENFADYTGSFDIEFNDINDFSSYTLRWDLAFSGGDEILSNFFSHSIGDTRDNEYSVINSVTGVTEDRVTYGVFARKRMKAVVHDGGHMAFTKFSDNRGQGYTVSSPQFTTSEPENITVSISNYIANITVLEDGSPKKLSTTHLKSIIPLGIRYYSQPLDYRKSKSSYYVFILLELKDGVEFMEKQ